MNDWRELTFMAALWAVLMVAVVWLSGCTATTLEQRAAASAAIEGHYVDGIGCTRIRTATGRAAVKAAASNAERNIEVRQ